MLQRTLEPEVMDSAAEAADYDAMDHAAVNQTFAADFLHVWDGRNPVLDVGTGTARIPLELCRRNSTIQLTAIDLAQEMLKLGQSNIERAGLGGRIELECWDAKAMPCPDGSFAAVISNTIIHHIPNPEPVLAGMVRATRPGGVLFVRDLIRPNNTAELDRLVALHAAGANLEQRQLLVQSFHAALTVAEVQQMVHRLGFAESTVRQTSDRHWTWIAYRGANS